MVARLVRKAWVREWTYVRGGKTEDVVGDGTCNSHGKSVEFVQRSYMS